MVPTKPRRVSAGVAKSESAGAQEVVITQTDLCECLAAKERLSGLEEQVKDLHTFVREKGFVRRQ